MSLGERGAFANLVGRKIKDVKVEKREERSNGPLMIVLDDESVIEISEGSGPGVHYEWDTYAQVKYEDRVIYRS